MSITNNHYHPVYRTRYFTIQPYWHAGLDPQIHQISGYTFTYKGEVYTLNTVWHYAEKVLPDGRTKITIWVVKSREFSNGLTTVLLEDENVVVELVNHVVQF